MAAPPSSTLTTRDEPGSALSAFFRDPFAGFGELMNLPSMSGMKLDVVENDRELRVVADLPGLKKEDISVEVDEQRVLHINAKQRHALEDRGESGGWRYHRMERSSSEQHRALRLPPNADVAGVSATCDAGVLNVVIPKLPGDVPTRRRIGIS